MQSSKESYEELELKLEHAHDQLKMIKNLTLGTVDASFPETLQAIAKLKDIANKHVMNEKVELLYSLIDDLSDAKDEVFGVNTLLIKDETNLRG